MLLLSPTALELEKHANWQWTWQVWKASTAFFALLLPWGTGIEHSLEVILCIVATLIPVVKVHYP